MNKEILAEVDNLTKKIQDLPLFSKYNKIKNKMLDNKELMDLISNYKKTQQELVKANYYKKIEDETTLEKKLSNYEKKLSEIPIYQEYIMLLEELNYIFGYIKEDLENYLYKKTNEEF